MTEKKIDILGSNILGAGDDTTDIIFAQNLIHRTSFCTRLRDNNAGILINRKFVGAYPLCKSYEYEEVAVEGDNTGAKQYRVVGFQPFDPATSREYVEILLNRLGVKRFERECQQNLEMVDDDKDFREYSEKYHVITYSEFVNYWKEKGVNVWSKELNRPIIPHNWNVGLGLDWGQRSDTQLVFSQWHDQTPQFHCQIRFHVWRSVFAKIPKRCQRNSRNCISKASCRS